MWATFRFLTLLSIIMPQLKLFDEKYLRKNFMKYSKNIFQKVGKKNILPKYVNNIWLV